AWRDGRIKQALIARALGIRSRQAALFSDGTYTALAVRGVHAERVVAFMRRGRDGVAITVVPRTAADLLRPGDIVFEREAWKDTTVVLPAPHQLTHAFDGQTVSAAEVAVGQLFERFPVALLVSAAHSEAR